MNSPGQEVPNMLLEKSEEIASGGMKRLSQIKDNAQMWVWLVVEVKFDYKKQYCIGTWNVRPMNQG